MVYTMVYRFLHGLIATELLQFPGGRAAQARKFVFPAIPEDGENQHDDDTQQDRADWSDRDWEDYNYSAVGRQGAGMMDQLAKLCDNLPGLEAEDITALLRDLPIPIPGDVPGMTVEEAIEG